MLTLFFNDLNWELQKNVKVLQMHMSFYTVNVSEQQKTIIVMVHLK